MKLHMLFEAVLAPLLRILSAHLRDYSPYVHLVSHLIQYIAVSFRIETKQKESYRRWKKLTTRDPLLEDEEECQLPPLAVHPVASSLLEKDFNLNSAIQYLGSEKMVAVSLESKQVERSHVIQKLKQDVIGSMETRWT